MSVSEEARDDLLDQSFDSPSVQEANNALYTKRSPHLATLKIVVSHHSDHKSLAGWNEVSCDLQPTPSKRDSLDKINSTQRLHPPSISREPSFSGHSSKGTGIRIAERKSTIIKKIASDKERFQVDLALQEISASPSPSASRQSKNYTDHLKAQRQLVLDKKRLEKEIRIQELAHKGTRFRKSDSSDLKVDLIPEDPAAKLRADLQKTTFLKKVATTSPQQKTKTNPDSNDISILQMLVTTKQVNVRQNIAVDKNASQINEENEASVVGKSIVELNSATNKNENLKVAKNNGVKLENTHRKSEQNLKLDSKPPTLVINPLKEIPISQSTEFPQHSLQNRTLFIKKKYNTKEANYPKIEISLTSEEMIKSVQTRTSPKGPALPTLGLLSSQLNKQDGGNYISREVSSSTEKITRADVEKKRAASHSRSPFHPYLNIVMNEHVNLGVNGTSGVLIKPPRLVTQRTLNEKQLQTQEEQSSPPEIVQPVLVKSVPQRTKKTLVIDVMEPSRFEGKHMKNTRDNRASQEPSHTSLQTPNFHSFTPSGVPPQLLRLRRHTNATRQTALRPLADLAPSKHLSQHTVQRSDNEERKARIEADQQRLALRDRDTLFKYLKSKYIIQK